MISIDTFSLFLSWCAPLVAAIIVVVCTYKVFKWAHNDNKYKGINKYHDRYNEVIKSFPESDQTIVGLSTVPMLSPETEGIYFELYSEVSEFIESEYPRYYRKFKSVQNVQQLLKDRIRKEKNVLDEILDGYKRRRNE